MNVPWEGYYFILGAVTILGIMVGSFLNVCIDRLPLQFFPDEQLEKIIKAKNYSKDFTKMIIDHRVSLVYPVRSVCFRCNRLIPWYENLPIVSYLVLKGRCSQCHMPIDLRIMVVEGLNGVFFALIVIFQGLTFQSVFLAITLSYGIVLVGIQREFKSIPRALQLLSIPFILLTIGGFILNV